MFQRGGNWARAMLKMLQPLSLPLLIVIFLLGLTSEANASPENEMAESFLECEILDKKEERCQQGDCPYKKMCPGTPHAYCFAMWKNGTNGMEIEMKGCWTNNDDCVNSSVCVQSTRITNINFCCCEETNCNSDIRSVEIPPTTSPVTVTENPVEVKELTNGQLARTLVYSIVPIVALAAIIVLAFWAWKRYRRQYHEQLPTVDPALSTPPSPAMPLPIRLVEVRAHGRFGSVWKAQLHDSTVAVKIFPLQDKQSWITEQEIYRLPQMNHDNILHFIGTEKRGDNLNIEFWLVTEFQTNGSLCEFLKGNTVTWTEVCKIAESMATGLSFLHDEVAATRSQEMKPAVAHRDFKSKNVLIKSDLTAVIADFGLALKFEPGKSPGETHGLVGTRRYMAPEVLEGAISFNRDAFLRIDMYACGLVLWEVMSRCTSVDGPVGEYQLPFEEEIGQHPTLEDMQELVVINKVRPSCRDHWLRHPGMEALAGTVEECWDHDAEARLSADCVLERVIQLGRTVNNTSNNTTTSNTTNTSNFTSLPTAAMTLCQQQQQLQQQQQPLLINTNQGLPPVSPVIVQTL